VFSSLDNEVVGFVYEKCIKELVAKYQRTIILVTQKTQLVYSADYVSRPALMSSIHAESFSANSAEKLLKARKFHCEDSQSAARLSVELMAALTATREAINLYFKPFLCN
jgi:hypothetical protein